MEFEVHSHQHAQIVLETPAFKPDFDELTAAIHGISDGDIIQEFEAGVPSKSISKAINSLLKDRLVELGWHSESSIFQAPGYTDKRWRLDFAKNLISVEIAFNHGEAIAWNLLKPVLASQQNHVRKAIQTEVGVIVCATKSMKTAGNFDNAVGEYEKFLRYLTPLQQVLPTPILLLGLHAPETFRVAGPWVGGHSIGTVVRLY
jgi:hypothetical protein